MRVEKEGFPILNEAVGVFQIGFALADGLDLGAAEGDSGLVFLEEEVVVPSGAIDGRIAGPGGDGVARPLFGRVGFDEMGRLTGHRSVTPDGVGPLSSYRFGRGRENLERAGEWGATMADGSASILGIGLGTGVRYYTRRVPEGLTSRSGVARERSAAGSADAMLAGKNLAREIISAQSMELHEA
jgi:hypothetical protein